MKFEDFLMPSSEKQRKRIALEEEVEELQGVLKGELQMNSVLRNALRGPLLSCPCLSSLLPLEVVRFCFHLIVVAKLRFIRNKPHHRIYAEVSSEEPNRLSEELLQCLTSIFLKLNQPSPENERVAPANKHNLKCINSKGFSSKNTFNCKARSSITNDDGISQGSDCTDIDFGAYKNYIQITRNSLKTAQLSDSSFATRKLRALLHKLCYVDLSFLSNKQKLAFWINIYNASIMHAYLQYGLPNTQEGMLTLLNKAALNVGGLVLNALAIEHYLLRLPSDPKHDLINEKEMILRRAYGLQYPEPNITFALCRGNWASPALFIYTPEEVVNQLSRAKVEYLEASIRVTYKRKVLVPKLLQWHMQDFAEDMESLIEWIYSQLPPNGILKRAIMECLYESRKVPTGKMIEVVPYQYEFQYLLPD